MNHPPDGCRIHPATEFLDNPRKLHRQPPQMSPLPSLVEGRLRLPTTDDNRAIPLKRHQPASGDGGSDPAHLSGALPDPDRRMILAAPETLPWRDTKQIRRQRVVVVAPHPDDETLGCGGAISLLCSKSYNVKVLVVSDGTLSHPNSRKYPAPALQSLRERETIAALKTLGVHRSAITFLGLKDGSVPTFKSAHFPIAKTMCQAYFKQFVPDTVFLPWRHDPHADHRATWQLIQAAFLGLGISPQKIEYPIWDWDKQQQKPASDMENIAGWRLDISSVIDRKLTAIAAYRSQLGRVIDDDPEGFCLSTELLTNFTRPWEVYFEEIG